MTQNWPELLKPYRDRIDELDREIIDLLRARYDVIEEVGILKCKENIPAVIEDRVVSVRENAARYAGEKKLDTAFIRTLWAQLIDHSCALEESIAKAEKEKTAASG